MKITDWLGKLRHKPQGRPDYRELQELSEIARRAANESNYKGLTDLIRQCRNSDEAVERIALAIAKSEPFITPSCVIDRYSIEMMDALMDTRFMERHGNRLSDIAVEDASMIHGLLAMYTFMQDSEQELHPEENLGRRNQKESEAAIRILDYRLRNRTVSELCNLAAYSLVPSRFVMMRYGLEELCDTYRCTEGHTVTYANHQELLQTETDMCRAAEKAVEGIPDVRLPDFYLEYLNRELDRLGRIAMSPDTVNDLIHIKSFLLTKYGIDKNALPEERSRQALKAYCELDARCVRMTGRRPYADSLVAALDKKAGETNTVGDKVQQRPAVRNHIRNPPPSKGKGRKPSF